MMHVEYCTLCGRTYFYYKYRYVCPYCDGALIPIEKDVEKFISLSEEERRIFVYKYR